MLVLSAIGYIQDRRNSSSKELNQTGALVCFVASPLTIIYLSFIILSACIPSSAFYQHLAHMRRSTSACINFACAAILTPLWAVTVHGNARRIASVEEAYYCETSICFNAGVKPSISHQHLTLTVIASITTALVASFVAMLADCAWKARRRERELELVSYSDERMPSTRSHSDKL
ncbi:hypothetical protein NLJ89_g1094 [Agrocybe chaxingu]|uniref:Uncharacterized protein n=1 Tax=Agrocybe chaxingu TaxID=84603 RepID=A0A9W8N0Q9_9AGAR|nr:hypothetical protein NLJ89_g1094 [Agrocybe chaxingu]